MQNDNQLKLLKINCIFIYEKINTNVKKLKIKWILKKEIVSCISLENMRLSCCFFLPRLSSSFFSLQQRDMSFIVTLPLTLYNTAFSRDCLTDCLSVTAHAKYITFTYNQWIFTPRLSEWDYTCWNLWYRRLTTLCCGSAVEKSSYMNWFSVVLGTLERD